MFKRRILSSTLDLIIGSIIIFLIVCYFFNILKWLPPVLYIVLWGIYLFVADLLGGRTFGKSICKLNVVSKKQSQSPYKQLFFRDFILKFGVFTLIPFIILFFGVHLELFLCLIIVFSVQIFINLIYFLFKKELIWDTISQTKTIKYIHDPSIKKLRFLRETGAFLIDFSLIVVCSTISYFVYMRFEYIPYYLVFLIVAILYSHITLFIFKNTIGNQLFRINFQFSKDKNYYKTIIIKESIKWFPVIIILSLLKILHYENNFINIVFILGLYFFLHIMSKLATRRSWSDWIINIRKVDIEIPKTKRMILSFLIFIFFVTSFLLLQNWNNNYPSKINFLGFRFYTYNVHYPNNQNLKNKVAYIENINTTPKEYIFDLFKKYDMVVLCETYHPEMTQWDFIYDVVTDPRFINNVGHLFTEYGASNYQDTVNKYLTTHFQNNTLLEMATTDLLRHEGQWMFWSNYNFFNFLKKVNQKNNSLPDSLRIREYFSDVDTYDKSIENKEEYAKINVIHRDSCMASTITKTFKTIQKDSTRKKCLVIMNYRHAFNDTKTYKNKRNYVHYYNTTSYLFHYFKCQVANVFINNISIGENGIVFIPSPIQNSSWDKAFEMVKNKPVGFDFNNSPFGTDVCDIYFNWGKRTTDTYQDIFTGMVFLNPTTSFWFKEGNLPYIMDNFETEYTRRLLVSGEDTTNLATQIKQIKSKKMKTSYLYENPFLLLSANFPISIYLFAIFFGFIALILSLIKKNKYSNF